MEFILDHCVLCLLPLQFSHCDYCISPNNEPKRLPKFLVTGEILFPHYLQ
jgi:hypothetical protein